MGTEAYNITQSKDYYQKQLAHEKEALHYMESGDGALAPPPHTIALAVNNRCMLKCLHCDVGEARRYKKTKNFFYQRGTGDEAGLREIPLDILKKLVDEVQDFQPVIRPTFLEPLLRGDLFDFARYVKDKGLVFNIQTNGVLLEKRHRELVDTGVDVLRVSLDGPKHIHDYIRGVNGTFDRVIDGLRQTIDYKKRMNVQKPVLGVSFTISGINYLEIVSFFDVLKELDVLDHVYISLNFLRFVTQSEADAFNKLNSDYTFMTESSVDNTQNSDIEIDKLINELETLLNKYPQNDYKYHFFPGPLTKQDIRDWFLSDNFLYPEISCHVPWAHCQILYNGDVVVNGRCCSPSFGNIYDQDFLEIWNSPIARNFRRTLKRYKNFPVCNRCCRKFNVAMLS